MCCDCVFWFCSPVECLSVCLLFFDMFVCFSCCVVVLLFVCFVVSVAFYTLECGSMFFFVLLFVFDCLLFVVCVRVGFGRFLKV